MFVVSGIWCESLRWGVACERMEELTWARKALPE